MLFTIINSMDANASMQMEDNDMKVKVRIPILFTKSRPFKVKNKVLHRKMKHKERLA